MSQPDIPFDHPYRDRDMRAIATLRDIMARLRDPHGGCPWDVAQDFASIAPYTIEEAYEVADAIARGDMDDLKDELGDLLLQVVCHAQMAAESGAFDFDAVVGAITAKLVRRHPHVFGDEAVRGTGEVNQLWERIKAAERAAKGITATETSVIDGVPLALPALTRAAKLQAKAARAGFDWPDASQVIAKLREELDELEAELDAGDNGARIRDEMGDVLFAAVNLARHAGADPESALRQANDKFSRRFKMMEDELTADGSPLSDHSLDAMEEGWQRAKQAEGKTSP